MKHIWNRFYFLAISLTKRSLLVRPTVRRKEAGVASLDVTVTTPLSRELPLEVKTGVAPGTLEPVDTVDFQPTLPGKYRFNICYGGHEVPRL